MTSSVLPGWLAGWLPGWLPGWLAACLPGCLPGWLAGLSPCVFFGLNIFCVSLVPDNLTRRDHSLQLLQGRAVTGKRFQYIKTGRPMWSSVLLMVCWVSCRCEIGCAEARAMFCLSISNSRRSSNAATHIVFLVGSSRKDVARNRLRSRL